MFSLQEFCQALKSDSKVFRTYFKVSGLPYFDGNALNGPECIDVTSAIDVQCREITSVVAVCLIVQLQSFCVRAKS